jgi:hypothetical protein
MSEQDRQALFFIGRLKIRKYKRKVPTPPICRVFRGRGGRKVICIAKKNPLVPNGCARRVSPNRLSFLRNHGGEKKMNPGGGLLLGGH